MDVRVDLGLVEGGSATHALFLESTAHVEKHVQTEIIQALINKEEGTIEKEKELATTTFPRETNTSSDTTEDDGGYTIQTLFREYNTETEEGNQTEVETTSQHIARAESTIETNDPLGHKFIITQSTCDQKKTSADASADTAQATQILQSNPTQAAWAQALPPAESQRSPPVQHVQLNKPQQLHTLLDTDSDRPHFDRPSTPSGHPSQLSPQSVPAPPMGTTASKTAAQASIAVNNLQEDLKRHSELLRNHSTMNQVDRSSPYEISSIGFHTKTVVTILMVLAVIALAGYATLHCLRKGVLCPNILTKMPYLAAGHLNGTHDIGPHNVRNIYPDTYYVNPMQPPAQRLAVLPREFVDGRCWAADNRPLDTEASPPPAPYPLSSAQRLCITGQSPHLCDP